MCLCVRIESLQIADMRESAEGTPHFTGDFRGRSGTRQKDILNQLPDTDAVVEQIYW